MKKRCGSDVRLAADLLLQAANEQDGVLQAEKLCSQVIFEDFADNALTLDLYFWLELGELINMRLIRSNIRFRIDALFRENGISIAFPQRDVHLSTATPLQIKMVTTETPSLAPA
jgi:potassium-dependent mechanosensitive channel